MWKKKEPESSTPQPTAPSKPPVERKPATPNRSTERALIGPSVKIRGEIMGEEDLVIQGQIDGKVVVKGKGVTVGKSGKVRADIHARSIRVEGQVRGDLRGEQEVIIDASGDVEGNLIAPSVRLENGSRFKGSIDMEKAHQPAVIPAHPRPTSPTVASTTGAKVGPADGSAKSPADSPGRPPQRS